DPRLGALAATGRAQVGSSMAADSAALFDGRWLFTVSDGRAPDTARFAVGDEARRYNRPSGARPAACPEDSGSGLLFSQHAGRQNSPFTLGGQWRPDRRRFPRSDVYGHAPQPVGGRLPVPHPGYGYTGLGRGTDAR